MEFPQIVAIGIYHSDIAAKGKAVSHNRKTTMFEIELPIEDGGTSFIDSGRHPIRTDTLICVKPGQTRHTCFPFRCYYIHLIVPKGPLYDLLTVQPDFITTENIAMYQSHFRQLCQFYETGLESDTLMLHSLILSLIYHIDRDSKKQASFSNKDKPYAVIEHSIRYIQDNLTADLSLDALAKKFSFSPTYFHKLFKASTGRTLREYVEHQRITSACNLLVSTNMTLTEIAYTCGFSSQAYFSFVFKRHMDKTPKEYAKEIFKRYE